MSGMLEPDPKRVQKRSLGMRRLMMLPVFAAATVSVMLASGIAAAPRTAAAVECSASAVHYRPAVRPPHMPAFLPWLASTNSSFRAYLFYWGGTSWKRSHPHDARIFTTRAHARFAPKVLWSALGRSTDSLIIQGDRLDGPGSFVSHYEAAIGGREFPSYVQVPTAGCWRVTVRSGALEGSVTFAATDKS
jgi:hypothetical protein